MHKTIDIDIVIQASWRLKSPDTRQFIKEFVQIYSKSKVCITGLLCGKTIGDPQWPVTEYEKRSHGMTSYRIWSTSNGRIRLSVSTVKCTYELSGVTHVISFRSYGKHSTGPCTYGPWARTYNKLFSLSALFRFAVTEPSTKECHVGHSREFAGRHSLLVYLWTVEYDHWFIFSVIYWKYSLYFLFLPLESLFILWRHRVLSRMEAVILFQ